MKFLIVGLGNPGEEYDETRHNIGFKALDALAGVSNASFVSVRHGWSTTIRHKGRQIILLKPNTFMNLSGKAVSFWMQKEKIPLSNLLIVTDDLALPFGTLRLKMKGSDGGHNGLKDIQSKIGGKYPRLRFGIGAEFKKGGQVNYVLSPWDSEESQKMEERLARVSEMMLSFCTIGAERTMNHFNNS